MIRTLIAVFGAAFLLGAVLATSAGATDVVPVPRPDVVVLERSAPEALDNLVATVLGGITAALVFVGSVFVTFRPLIMAKVAEAIASVQFDKRQVFETAVAAGLELHPNKYELAADYVKATIPDTLRDLGINLDALPSIVEARKLALDRQRQDRAKSAG